jgi:CheY-like chemotaxis protein
MKRKPCLIRSRDRDFPTARYELLSTTVRIAVHFGASSIQWTKGGNLALNTNGRSGRRILIIDDNVDVAASLAALLRVSGHEVRLAHDGAWGLKDAQAFRPEFVFLDLGLPGMDGFQVARSLRREPGLESARIIALTGDGHADSREQALLAGCDQFILKPMDPAFLDSLLRAR